MVEVTQDDRVAAEEIGSLMYSYHEFNDRNQRELAFQAAARHRLASRPQPATGGDVEAVAEVINALDGVIAAFPSYRTRNGKSVSIEASDGEKCWIIHDDVRNDAVNARASLPALLAAAEQRGREAERKAVVKWLRTDADQTEVEAAHIVKNTCGNARAFAAEWKTLVGMKRGIASAITNGDHRHAD